MQFVNIGLRWIIVQQRTHDTTLATNNKTTRLTSLVTEAVRPVLANHK